jgi:predicted metal-binding membrane protein
VTRSRVAAADTGALLTGLALLAVAVPSWLFVVRDARNMTMAMPGASASLAEGVAFTARWGVMMAAMMLPSAAPMVLLYRTVRRRLASEHGDRAIPPWAFAAVYLLLWLATGVPVYLASVAVAGASARWPAAGSAMPYAVAAVLAAAGLYQLTGAKRACLRHCESPLGLLMRRWRSGYAATLRLAASHAGYCVGCCWGLMAILVAAGAMSVPWVLAIAAVVFAEKVLPGGGRTARVVGVALLALAVAVALRPELAGTMRPAMRM